MPGPVDSATPRSGMVENVRVAVEVSFVVAAQAQLSGNRLISKTFRFSGLHIRFLVGVRHDLKETSCCQFIIRKSCQGASTNSKWFRNDSEKSGLGVIYRPPVVMEGLNDNHKRGVFCNLGTALQLLAISQERCVLAKTDEVLLEAICIDESTNVTRNFARFALSEI